MKSDKKTHLGLIRKRSLKSSTTIENSKLTVNFGEDYQTVEHQLTILPNDLESNHFISSWSFNSDSQGIEIVSNTCEIQAQSTGKKTEKTCTASNDIKDNRINFSYKFNLENTEQLLVTYKYKKTPAKKQILYKAESIIIPIFLGSANCDYKYIIPDGYVNLGLYNNNIIKESDTVYRFKGVCPSDRIDDVIRFSHNEVKWDADTKYYIKSKEKFGGDVRILFPRFYQGGRLTNENYKITDQDNVNYDATKIIDKDDETKYNISFSAADKNEVGIELKTSFTNKLTNEFKVYLPEKYYDIDLSNVPEEIQNKAKEIQKQKSDLPDYHRIGKFVHEYLQYAQSYIGKNLTLEEIYHGKKGVCEHFTLLYNAMLNTIGIKTLTVAGWAFDEEQTSGDKNTTAHAWTLALINGKWIELDSTWGLFEGLSAGYVLKNFGQDIYHYSYPKADVVPTYEYDPTIKLNKIIDNTNNNSGNNNNNSGNNNNNSGNKNNDNNSGNNSNGNNNNSGNNNNDNNDSGNNNNSGNNSNGNNNNSGNNNNDNNNSGNNSNGNNNNNSGNKSDENTQVKTDDQADDDIQIIRRSGGYYLKYSLTLLILFFF